MAHQNVFRTREGGGAKPLVTLSPQTRKRVVLVRGLINAHKATFVVSEAYEASDHQEDQESAVSFTAPQFARLQALCKYLQRPLRNLQAPQDPAPAGDAQ